MGNLLTQLALFGAIAFFLVKFVHSFGGDIVFMDYRKRLKYAFIMSAILAGTLHILRIQ